MVEFLVGVLRAHESVDHLGVLDLLDVIVELFFGNRDAQFGRRDGLVDLRQFFLRQTLLKFPFIPASLIARLGRHQVSSRMQNAAEAAEKNGPVEGRVADVVSAIGHRDDGRTSETGSADRVCRHQLGNSCRCIQCGGDYFGDDSKTMRHHRRCFPLAYLVDGAVEFSPFLYRSLGALYALQVLFPLVNLELPHRRDGFQHLYLLNLPKQAQRFAVLLLKRREKGAAKLLDIVADLVGFLQQNVEAVER